MGINHGGVIVGCRGTQGGQQAILITSGTITEPTLPGVAQGINGFGVIVGSNGSGVGAGNLASYRAAP